MYRSLYNTATNSNLSQLQHRREQILQEMAAIDRLRRDHLSRQFFQSTRQGKTCRQGPYYVLQRWFNGKNLCERVPAGQVEGSTQVFFSPFHPPVLD